MINNPILDILISMVLIFALLSVLVSILNEWASHYNNRRSTMLREAIIKLLKDPNNLDYGELFYNHLSIETISKIKPYPWYNIIKLIGNKLSPRKIPPQYISSSMFAEVVIDVIAAQALHTQKLIPLRDNSGKIILDADGKKTYNLVPNTSPETGTKERFEAALKLMNPSPFNDLLRGYLDKAGGDMEKVKASLENWFNDYMNRVSGWFKSQQRGKLLIMGFIVAILLNVDSLHLIKTLSLDNNLRDRLVANAIQVADSYEKMSDTLKSNINAQIQIFKKANDSVAKLPEFKALDSTKVKENPKMFVDLINEKYPKQYKKFTEMITREDSLSKAYISQVDDVLGIAASLNLPIGYSDHQAPLSWFNKTQPTLQTAKSDGLMHYNAIRNAGGFWVVLKYMFGICITAFSLSFGAPFWFDLLVKFVNIRRSGIKPEATKTT